MSCSPHSRARLPITQAHPTPASPEGHTGARLGAASGSRFLEEQLQGCGSGVGAQAQDLTLGVGASPYTHTRGHTSGSKSISAYLWSTQSAPPPQKTVGATQVPSGSREAPSLGSQGVPRPAFWPADGHGGRAAGQRREKGSQCP